MLVSWTVSAFCIACKLHQQLTVWWPHTLCGDGFILVLWWWYQKYGEEVINLILILSMFVFEVDSFDLVISQPVKYSVVWNHLWFYLFLVNSCLTWLITVCSEISVWAIMLVLLDKIEAVMWQVMLSDSNLCEVMSHSESSIAICL